MSRRTTFHSQLAEALRSNPGVEMRAGVYRTRYCAQEVERRIRTGRRMPSYVPVGAYEARHQDLESGGTAVYVRYFPDAVPTPAVDPPLAVLVPDHPRPPTEVTPGGRVDEQHAGRVQSDTETLTEVAAWALAHLHDEQVNVAALVNRSGLDHRTFRRRFVSLTGRTPLEWLTLQRVRRARRLLEDSDCSDREVADRVGFATITALRNHFRQHLGVSLASYRRSCRTPRLARP